MKEQNPKKHKSEIKVSLQTDPKQKDKKLKHKSKSCIKQEKTILAIQGKPCKILQNVPAVQPPKSVFINIKTFMYNLFSIILGFIYSIIHGIYELLNQFARFVYRNIKLLWIQNQLFFVVFVILYIMLLMPFSINIRNALFRLYVKFMIALSTNGGLQKLICLNQSQLNDQCIY